MTGISKSFKKGVFFYSAAGGQIASKSLYEKATASCLFIKDWKRGAFSGQGRRQKPVRLHRNSSHSWCRGLSLSRKEESRKSHRRGHADRFCAKHRNFLSFSGGTFPCLSRKESCRETSCAAFRNSFAHFYHEIWKNNRISLPIIIVYDWCRQSWWWLRIKVLWYINIWKLSLWYFSM